MFGSVLVRCVLRLLFQNSSHVLAHRRSLRIVGISLAFCYTSDMLIQCSQTSRDQSPAVCVSVLFQISDEIFSFEGKKVYRLRNVFVRYFMHIALMPPHWLVNFLTMVCGRSQRHLVNKKTLKNQHQDHAKKCGYYNKLVWENFNSIMKVPTVT